LYPFGSFGYVISAKNMNCFGNYRPDNLL